jgi:hypothetical protein
MGDLGRFEPMQYGERRKVSRLCIRIGTRLVGEQIVGVVTTAAPRRSLAPHAIAQGPIRAIDPLKGRSVNRSVARGRSPRNPRKVEHTALLTSLRRRRGMLTERALSAGAGTACRPFIDLANS